MHKVNTRWGELEVRYARNDEGREWLRAVNGAEPQDWVLDRSKPPRALTPRDLTITGDWDKHLTLALAADIEDDRARAAAKAEDDKFKYQPAPRPAPKQQEKWRKS